MPKTIGKEGSSLVPKNQRPTERGTITVVEYNSILKIFVHSLTPAAGKLQLDPNLNTKRKKNPLVLAKM